MRRRLIEALARIIDHMEGNPIVKGRERLRKIIDDTIKKGLDLNGLSIDMVYDWTQSYVVGKGFVVAVV